MATGIFSPRSAISRQCAAPTLWRCQCIASSRRPITWMRYMPTLRTPVLGSRVITPGSVMYGPPSSGQHTGTGNCARSTSCSRRSEEHTSELQSPYDLVCRLLLEKKKKTKFNIIFVKKKKKKKKKQKKKKKK